MKGIATGGSSRMAGETGVDREGPSPPGPSNSIFWVGPGGGGGDLIYV